MKSQLADKSCSPEEAAMLRARSLRCWEGLDVCIEPAASFAAELGFGQAHTNKNFIATSASGERWFVRIASDLPAFAISRAREQAAASSAARSVAGPEVFYSELPDALVTAFLSGARALTADDLRTATLDSCENVLLAALAAMLRLLHRTPAPTELLDREGASPHVWAPPDLPQRIAYARSMGYSRMPTLLDTVEQTVEAMEIVAGPVPGPPVFCHLDLWPDNIVLVASKSSPHADEMAPRLRIVDFEFAGLAQPLMDLATLSIGADLSCEQDHCFLSCYFGEDVDPSEVQRFQALKLIMAAHAVMWGVVAEVSGSSALAPDEAAADVDSFLPLFHRLRESHFDQCMHAASL